MYGRGDGIRQIKGLIPKYAKKGLLKMSPDQKQEMNEKLKMGVRHMKPYPHDKRRSGDAENILKKT